MYCRILKIHAYSCVHVMSCKILSTCTCTYGHFQSHCCVWSWHDMWNPHVYVNIRIISLFMQLAFKWFDKGMTDLEHESQVFMFNTRVLKVDPSMLDSAGYSCLRNFFETINLSERKLKRISGTLNLVSIVYCNTRYWPFSIQISCVDCRESGVDWHRLLVEGEFFYHNSIVCSCM